MSQMDSEATINKMNQMMDVGNAGDAGDAGDAGVAMSQKDSEAASNEMLDDGCGGYLGCGGCRVCGGCNESEGLWQQLM